MRALQPCATFPPACECRALRRHARERGAARSPGLTGGISHPPVLFRTAHFWRSWCRSVFVPRERLWWWGLKRRNPPPVRFGGGLETFGSCLVSSLAVSGNRLRRSRNNRHRRRRRNGALSGERKIHTDAEDSTRAPLAKVKIPKQKARRSCRRTIALLWHDWRASLRSLASLIRCPSPVLIR
jgi:hypothetical protein